MLPRTMVFVAPPGGDHHLRRLAVVVTRHAGAQKPTGAVVLELAVPGLQASAVVRASGAPRASGQTMLPVATGCVRCSLVPENAHRAVFSAPTLPQNSSSCLSVSAPMHCTLLPVRFCPSKLERRVEPGGR